MATHRPEGGDSFCWGLQNVKSRLEGRFVAGGRKGSSRAGVDLRQKKALAADASESQQPVLTQPRLPHPGHKQQSQGQAQFACPLVSPFDKGLLEYAGHALILGGVSPLRPREVGPLSEGKGVTARWGLKEAGATATT